MVVGVGMGGFVVISLAFSNSQHGGPAKDSAFLFRIGDFCHCFSRRSSGVRDNVCKSFMVTGDPLA